MKKLLILTALILLTSCESVQSRYKREMAEMYLRQQQRELTMINAINHCKDLRPSDNGNINSPFRKCVIEKVVKEGY